MNPGSATTARPAAMIFIFVTVLIDILAFGMIIPVLPHLVEDFVGGDTATAARWVGVFGTAFAAIQFFSTPVQGAFMSLGSLAGVFAPVMFATVFAEAIDRDGAWYFPGAPFLLSAAVVAAAWIVSERATRPRPPV